MLNSDKQVAIPQTTIKAPGPSNDLVQQLTSAGTVSTSKSSSKAMAP